MTRFLTTLTISLLAAAPALACPPEYSEPQPGQAQPPEARAVHRQNAGADLRLRLIADDNAPKSAYIGVLMSPLPDALAAHVGQDGLMIANVLKDSPADGAGLQRYDVIRSANGKAITSMGDLAAQVENAGVGGNVELAIIRAGKPQTVSINAASRPNGEQQYKYEPEDTTIANPPTIRGHRLRVGPSGALDLEDLGGLRDLSGLPQSVRELLRDYQNWPTTHSFTFPNGAQGWSTGNVVSEFTASVNNNGKQLTVHRGTDGRVDVERTDENGNKKSTSYDNADEVKKADDEAFKLLEQHRATNGSFSWRQPSAQNLSDARRQWSEAINDHLRQLHMQRESLDAQWQALEKMLSDMPAARQQMSQLEKRMRDASDEVQRAREALEKAQQSTEATRDAQNAAANAKADADSDDLSATMLADGRIQVTCRANGTTMHYEFKNKADFETREPALFARFKALKD